jgi:hypothetical protein
MAVVMIRQGGSQWCLLLVRRDTSHARMDGLKQTKTTMPRTKSSLSTVNVFNKFNASMPTAGENQWYERNQETIRGEKRQKHFDFE